MSPHHLQGGVDVRATVGMPVRWPAQVKQHQSATTGRQLQKLGQRGHGLVLNQGTIHVRQGRHGSKRIPLCVQHKVKSTKPADEQEAPAESTQVIKCVVKHGACEFRE